MGAYNGKTKNSNAIGTARLCAQLEMAFRDACLLVPPLSLPSNPQYSVSLTITPAVDLSPAYANSPSTLAPNSPSTLALVLFYFRYNFYAPLLYLALVKHRVVFDDDDDGKSMMMVAPELAKESPLFGGMNAAKLLEEIHKWRGLLLEGLTDRKSELEEELTSIEKWRRVWSEADLAPSILFAVINSATLVAAKVMPTSITALLLASLVAGNLLVAVAMKSVGWWFSMTDDKSKSQLESQKDGIEAMRQELPDLELIRSLLENLKIERTSLRDAEIKQYTLATDDQSDQGGVTQTAAAHLERQLEEKKKKKVKKAIRGVHKMVDRVESEVKKAAADFVNIIAK